MENKVYLWTLDKYPYKLIKKLSELSHPDLSRISAKDGKVIDYESVFYRTDATSVRKYETD